MCCWLSFVLFFCFNQKTAYEMRISDWSSDVCSSDLFRAAAADLVERRLGNEEVPVLDQLRHLPVEEGQQQGTDVGAVDVGVGHDHDLVVAQFLEDRKRVV